MYKQNGIYSFNFETKVKTLTGIDDKSITRTSDSACIPFDPANVDYQQFKQAINDDTAQLEDADGNLMTAEEAKAFVATLP